MQPQAADSGGAFITRVHGFNFLMLPGLDGIRDYTQLLVRIRMMMVFLGKMLDGLMDGLRLRMGVMVFGHAVLLAGLAKKKPLA